MGTRVNSSAINASSTAASAYSVQVGVACLAGDLLIVSGDSNGTHAALGMTVQDAVNAVNFTNLDEEQGSNASSRYLQVMYEQTSQALGSTTNLTFTPYAASTSNAFVADIFRGYTATQSQGDTKANSPGAALTGIGPAFGGVPQAGALVVSAAQWSAVTTGLSIASPYTLGSANATTTGQANGYVLSADGTSTYAANWTAGTSASWSVINATFNASPVGGIGSPAGMRGLGPRSEPLWLWKRQRPFMSPQRYAYPATVAAPVVITPAAASLTLGAFAPAVATPRLLTPANASLVLAEFAPSVATPRLVAPAKASLIVSGFAPSVATPRLLTPASRALVLAKVAPAVATPRLLTPANATLVLAGYAPALGGSVSVAPAAATLAVSGFAPTVTVTAPANLLITPPAAQLVLGGLTPDAQGDRHASGLGYIVSDTRRYAWPTREEPEPEFKPQPARVNNRPAILALWASGALTEEEFAALLAAA